MAASAIRTLLVDADGVIQYAPTDWLDAFSLCLGDEDPELRQRFTDEIYAAETACLTGRDDFAERLRLVLAKWNRAAAFQQILDAMFSIEAHAEIVRVFQALRRGGVRCYLASNQQSSRARHMSATFDYSRHFDGEFYSCFLGAAKPEARFFELALAASGAAPASTLFIDDRPANVEAARRSGLHALLFDGRDGAAALWRELAPFGLAPQRA